MMHISTARVVVVRLAAIFLIGLAAYWIFVFTQADFRPHRRGLYLSLAVVSLVIGGGVWLRYGWALLASLVLSVLGLAFTGLMLIGALGNLALWVQALILGAYIAVVAPLGFSRRGS